VETIIVRADRLANGAPLEPFMLTNAELLERRNAAVVRGVGHATPITASRASNSEVWDVEGKRYIDFAGGIAVLNTGHCHPHVIAKIREQLDRFTHTCFQVLLYEPYIALAEKLNAIVPISGQTKSIFLTTGAEAIENAIKIARVATGRPGIIAFTGGFHGRTVLAMNLTGKVVPYKKGLGPTLPDIWHVPFPVEHHGVSVEDTLKYLDFLFKADIDPSRVAAIIVEPVQGEGGFHPAPPELMGALRRVCDQYGIVLIADEIQTGFGRTGKMFAMEHYDVQPDLICVAKSLSGGLPLSGVVGRANLMDAADPGGLGGTFAGNPLACAAALETLRIFREQGILERNRALAAHLGARTRELEALPHVAEVRQRGMIVAVELAADKAARTPYPWQERRGLTIYRHALSRSVLLRPIGNVVYFMPPYVVTPEDIDRMVEVAREGIERATCD
jgi:4-aminobutyrate aminotransferase / (S)-3-amino-2-methylpropionate transaminase / 5-aminovalerate transaminase